MPTFPTNTLLTISMITREHLRVLENNLVMTKNVHREYDKAFGVAGAQIGTTLNIRKPIRPQVVQGPALPGAIQSTVETSVPLVLNKRPLVALAFSDQDRTLNIDDFAGRIITPSAAAVANQIDNDGCAQFSNVFNMVGTPGTVPNSLTTGYTAAMQRLNEEACPRDGQRALVISPAMEASIIGGLAGLLNPPKSISEQYLTGTMGKALGFKWNMDQNVQVQTFGAQGGAGKVNGAGQTGSSLITNGWTASVTGLLNAGDVFTIAGVYAVNPQSKQTTGSLRNFVVTAAVNSDATGNATIPISPAITTSGGSQNVTGSPATTAVITVQGAANVNSPQALAFHKDAFALGSADLVLPRGVDIAERVADDQLGLSLTYIRAYDINTGNYPLRVECLYGWVTQYAELAVRIAS